MVRYFISGILIFCTFNNESDTLIKKAFLQSVLYTISLIYLKIFVTDSPAITMVSSVIIFLCLILTSKVKVHSYIVTYSIFMSCLLEYINFLAFEIVSFARIILGMPEFTYTHPTRLLVGRIILTFLYSFSIFMIYKFSLINTTSLKKLSKQNIFSVFLSLAMGMCIYLKYYIKYTHSDKFYNILSVIFGLFIIISSFFIISSQTFVEIIDKIQKKKVNPAIEEAKLQKGNGYNGLKFKSKDLNSQTKYFQNELNVVGIGVEDSKARQLVYCAVLLNGEKTPDKANMTYGIYFYTGEILNLQPGSVETNIRNLLQNHWGSRDPEVLKKIEKNYRGPISKEICAPTPREFLLYLVKKYKKDNKVVENALNAKYVGIWN